MIFGASYQASKVENAQLKSVILNSDNSIATFDSGESQTFNLDNYFGASVTYGILGNDTVIGKDSVKQSAKTFLQLYSASLDVNLGILPPNSIRSLEMGIGFSKNLSAGVIYAQPNQFDSFDYMGIAVHLGPPSPGTPVYVSVTEPAKQERRANTGSTRISKG